MSNIEQLEEGFREYWETYKAIQMLDMSMADRRKLHDLVQAEWAPPIAFHDWCGKCVLEYLTYAFNQIDKQ